MASQSLILLSIIFKELGDFTWSYGDLIYLKSVVLKRQKQVKLYFRSSSSRTHAVKYGRTFWVLRSTNWAVSEKKEVDLFQTYKINI